jgi:prevent-host-death family protein
MLHWQLQEAKAKLSELMRLVKDAPQMITVHGKEEAVLLSKAHYDSLTQAKSNLFQFMQNSPLKGENITFERENSLERDINL